jgi:hypothetical protein
MPRTQSAHPVPQCLLRRHEGGGADPQPRTGERHGVRGVRDAEVDHPGAVPRDQHVGRFQVAVHLPGGVDGLERFGDARDEQQHGTDRQRAVPPYDLVERGTQDVGGGQPRRALVHPEVDHLGREQSVDAAGAWPWP